MAAFHGNRVVHYRRGHRHFLLEDAIIENQQGIVSHCIVRDPTLRQCFLKLEALLEHEWR